MDTNLKNIQELLNFLAHISVTMLAHVPHLHNISYFKSTEKSAFISDQSILRDKHAYDIHGKT